MEASETSLREAASPSTGGDFLLQLLQQRQPSPAFSASCGGADRNSFGDGNMLHSNGSGAAESPGSSSFGRASSSSEACAVEENQERPRFVSTSSAEASALDEEQARYQVHHDPAVAAMGPSHTVGEVRALANMYGNTDGDARRVLPFYDILSHHQMDQNQLCRHLHLGLQQVPPPDVSFPQPPSEHLLSFRSSPLVPSMQNQILRPYPYPRLPYSDRTTYVYVPSVTFPHTRQLTPHRFQDSTALPHPAFDELKSFCNDGLTNGETMAPARLLASRSMPLVSLSMIEDGLAPPSSQFYTQFGSIPVEMLQEKAGLNAAHQDTTGSATNPSDPFKGVSQHKSLLLEASTSYSGTHACQNRTLEDAGANVPSEMFSDGVIKKLEKHASAIDDAVTTTAPMILKLRCSTDNGSVPEGVRNVSDAKLMVDHGCGTTKARLSKPQKSADATRKGRIGSSLWVPVMKEHKEEARLMVNKKEEPNCNAMDLAAVSEDATYKEATTHKDLHQGLRSDQPNLPSGLPLSELVDSTTTQSSRNKASLRQGPLGLPSGSRVESAPSSATEQSKQALQLSPGADAVDMRMAEGAVASLKPSLDLSRERAEENAETLARSLSRLESATENEVEEDKASKSKNSNSQVRNSDGKKLDGIAARPMARLNRREPLNRLDARKCTSNMLAIYQSLIPLDDEEQRRNQLLGSLDELVKGIWPDARLYLFGSCANGLGVCNSDIDVCLSMEGKAATRSEVVSILADSLKANHMLNVQALTHARVPIVKYSDPKTGISCDVCVNNMLAVVNTRLLHDYAQIDVRLRQLAFMVKHWAKRRQVNETYCGTLSSYAYVLMCIHFLQQRRPPVLPCLQDMEPTYRSTVGNIECAYYDKVDNLKGFGQKNRETLADLVTSFFDYWAFRHDYTHTVVSIRTGNFLSKVEKDWTRRIGNERHLICIEDPFETSHDLGRVVDKHSIRVLRDEFQRAARIMRQDANPCVALFEPYIRQKAQAA